MVSPIIVLLKRREKTFKVFNVRQRVKPSLENFPSCTIFAILKTTTFLMFQTAHNTVVAWLLLSTSPPDTSSVSQTTKSKLSRGKLGREEDAHTLFVNVHL